MTTQLRPSELKFAGNMALLTAIGYIIGWGSILLRPEPQRAGPFGANASEFYPSFVEAPVISRVIWIAGILNSIIALGFIPTMARFIENEENRAQVTFGKNVAFVAYTITAIWFATILSYTPRVAAAYTSGSDAAKEVFGVYAFAGIDPDAILVFGLLPLWLIIMSYYGSKDESLTRNHAMVGYATALTSICAVVSIVVNSFALRLIALFGGTVLMPIWLILLRQRFLSVVE